MAASVQMSVRESPSNVHVVICHANTASISHRRMDIPWNVTHYITSARGREAACVLQYLLHHYDQLSTFTAFVHEDVGTHNPVWARWLACMKPSAQLVSLSPIHRTRVASLRVQTPRLRALAGALGIDMTAARSVPASCCGLIVVGRQRARMHGRHEYQHALRLLDAGNASAFDFEDLLHLAFGNTDARWLSNRSFVCEMPIQYEPVGAGALSHGTPMRQTITPHRRKWLRRSCGVADAEAEAGCDAVHMLKPKMGVAPVPVWQHCCAACASNLKCARWHWKVTGACATSEQRAGGWTGASASGGCRGVLLPPPTFAGRRR